MLGRGKGNIVFIRGYILSENRVTHHKNRFKGGILRTIKAYIDHNKLGELLVITGRITPQDLKSALSMQKQSHAPLGRIFVENHVISRRDLAFVLARQRLLRGVAAMMLFSMSLSLVQRKARADAIADIPAKISLHIPSSYSQAIPEAESWPALFGSVETRSDNLSAFTKWVDMFERFDASLDTREGAQIVLDLKKELKAYAELPLEEMADAVNAMMNKKKYIVDSKNWGKSDYWATPIEFMTRGGDCEDFAIAKYAALRALGVSEERLRLAIVHDERKNIPHAVLVVQADSGLLILDNQIKTASPAEEITHYRPIFSINRQAWWLHTSPDETVIASAH